MPFCTHCGTEILDSAKFCIGCGTKIVPEEASEKIDDITDDSIRDEARVSFNFNPYSNQSFALVVTTIVLYVNVLIPVDGVVSFFTSMAVLLILIQSLIIAYILNLFGIKLGTLIEKIFHRSQTRNIQVLKQGAFFSILFVMNFLAIGMSTLFSGFIIVAINERVVISFANMTNSYLLSSIVISGVVMLASRDFVSPNQESASDHSEE
jgi:hypothetical protein